MALAVGVYALTTLVYLLAADPARLVEHSPANHFALQAEAWLHGELALGFDRLPAYTHGNDFARHDGRWWSVFPPLPAALLVPAVALSRAGAEGVPDGLLFLLLAGVAPAVLFLSLEKLSDGGRSQRSVRENLALSLLFAFGTVYFFSAEQGTVWFGAHVVAAGLGAAYLYFALGASRPWLAGLALGLGVATRTPLLFAAPLFVGEAWRVSSAARRLALPPGAPLSARVRASWTALDGARFWALLWRFLLPVGASVAVLLLLNVVRFGAPLEFGYRFLTVAWRARIERWGLMDLHYLPRNLSVLLGGLPWSGGASPFPLRINAHGLALWFTTPLYFWLLWPRRRRSPHLALWVTVACVAVPTLLYQNSGWAQFGYRFSNDYAVFLFALLALGGRRFGKLFWFCALWSVAVNTLGALTFDRPAFADLYVLEPTQAVLHEPD